MISVLKSGIPEILISFLKSWFFLKSGIYSKNLDFILKIMISFLKSGINSKNPDFILKISISL